MENEKALGVLNAYLKEALPDYSVDSIVPATSDGENFSSTIFRARVKNAQSLLSLIIKVAPDNKALRSIFPLRSMYEQEAFYYQRIFPELVALQEEHNVSRPFKSYPALLKAQLEECNEVFVLEDMKALGYSGLKPRETLNYEHCVLVVKAYAKLHGAAYALKRHKPEVFAEMSRSTPDKIFQALSMSEVREQQLKDRSAIALKALDATEDAEAHERFLKFSQRMFRVTQNALQTESAGDYAVFTHSDSWVCNYLFKYENEVPVELCVLDWQMAHCGSPALDLSYLFFVCTDHELRQRHYDDLLQVYYSELASFLQCFNCDVGEVLPFNVLKDHLRRFSAYGMYMATIVLNLSLLQSGKLPSLRSASTERDLLQIRSAKESEDLELFNSRMKGAILDFVAYGYDQITAD